MLSAISIKVKKINGWSQQVSYSCPDISALSSTHYILATVIDMNGPAVAVVILHRGTEQIKLKTGGESAQH